MIRVGFVLEFDRGWLGGISYYRNLLKAVYVLPERKIEPVIFLGDKAATEMQAGLPPFRVLRSSLLDWHSPAWWVRRLVTKIFSRDVLLEHLLRRNGIHVLSHSGSLGRGSTIPCLCWMPDLQHRRMPHFFEAWEIKLRDNIIHSWGQTCAGIILSSNDAKKDMLELYPDCRAELGVLQFVSEVASEPPGDDGVDLAGTYGITGKYFLVANQFWAHKNHRVIIDALRCLKSSGRTVQVVATGNTHDYRQSGFYDELMGYAETAGVLDAFKVLGIVPPVHLSALMRNAVATVNPSWFEGWNTAVEEAKSLGKQVILSDIPVHREQNPSRAEYFLPDDAGGLAEILWERWVHYDWAADRAEMQRAAQELPMRQQEFGLKYQNMILEMCHGKSTDL